MTLILTNDDIRKSLKVQDCLDVMEETYRELASGRAVNRPTSQSYLPHSLPQASYNFKSVDGGIGKYSVFALRITSTVDQERRVNNSVRLEKLPLSNGLFVGLVELFSAETGELIAIMPDGVIQQTRVAVTSALGVKALARKDSEVLALIGSGGQAQAHFRFLTRVRPVKRVKIFSSNPDHRNAFAKEMQRETGIQTDAVESAERAVMDSDIVCTATNSSRPVLKPEWLRPGMHYNAIREFETDMAVLDRCDVVAIHTQFGGIQHYQPPGVIEDMPGVRREKPRDWSRYPEISDLIAGRARGRTNNKQITFFLNNVGTGVQFAALGYCAYRAAQENDLGHKVPTDWFLQDVKP